MRDADSRETSRSSSAICMARSISCCAASLARFARSERSARALEPQRQLVLDLVRDCVSLPSLHRSIAVIFKMAATGAARAGLAKSHAKPVIPPLEPFLLRRGEE